jgi:hypothetical protein
MPTPSIQTLRTDAQQVLNLDSISAVRSVVAATLANANAGTPLNPNLTTQQLWNEFYQIVTQPKSDIESIIANQLMKFLYAPPAPGGVGANGQVIFNDGGVLAGDPQFLWNKTTNLLTVTGSATITGDLTVATNKLKVTGGNVGIGTATPTNYANYTTLTINGTNGGEIDLTDGGTLRGQLFSESTGLTLAAVGGLIKFGAGTGGTEKMRLDASGNLLVGVASANANGGVLQLKSGITFPATQVASSDANTLDDYEEGTFTPTIIGTSTAGTGTYSVQSGTYTKVGRLVSCQIFLDWTAHTGTGDMRISGLPFQVSSASNYFAAAAIGYFSNVSLSAGNIATGYAINATSVITLGQYPTGGGAGAGIAMDTSGEILISVTYIV